MRLGDGAHLVCGEKEWRVAERVWHGGKCGIITLW